MRLRQTTVLLLGTAFVLALAGTGSTQTAPPAGPQVGNTAFIAQYECSPGDLAKVDRIIKEISAPTLSRMMAEGKVITWALLGTYLGGPANRTIVIWGKDPASLVQARLQYLPEIMAKPAWAELGRLCPRQQTTLVNMIANAASTK